MSSELRVSLEKAKEKEVDITNRENRDEVHQEHELEYGLDVPIAWRKGVGSCTKYQVS